jgi:hypothetical protein
MSAAAREDPRRVLVIHTDGNSFNNPTLKSLIDLLLDRGFEVDLRYPRTHAPMPQRVGIRLLPFGVNVRRLKVAVFDRLSWRPLATLCVLIERLFLYRRYDLVIGVDRQGLMEAGLLHDSTGIPHVCFSFEIMFESETSTRYKALECLAAQTVSLWVVQDETRARLLAAENHFAPERKFLLPLASAGIGSQSADRLRDRLGIPADRQVAMALGSVSGWSMTGRILSGVADWPAAWVLILHERYGRARAELGADLARFESLIGRRIFISETAADMVDDLGSVLSGVDVGLAFYEPDYKTVYTGRNLQNLGMASGKISTYLRYGVPVILNDIGLFPEEARQHGFGRVVTSPEEIGPQLDACSDGRHAANATRYFAQKLDFDVHAQALWSRLRDCMVASAATSAVETSS